MMNEFSKFEMDRFLSPDVSFAPVFIWVWNDTCTTERIDDQLSEMQRLGIRAFYILPEPKEFRPDSMPTNLTPDYLSADYFALCAYAVEQGKKRGMRCWIYDEGGWPSGGACGAVLRAHPEYARQVLKASERIFCAGDVYRKSSPDVSAAFLRDREMISDGYIFVADAVVTEYGTDREIHGAADYPDLLNKNATEYYIKITHEQYAAAMPDLLGRTVTAVFTDEPKAPCRPWSKELADEYQELYGESVLPYLPLLAQRVSPTPDTVHVLRRWNDLCSRMFCAHYLLPCKAWANDHGMAFTGHLDKDHDPLGCVRGGRNFHLMRALRCFDIPGVDVIWRQIYPEGQAEAADDMNAYNGFFPRYASSAAAQNGTKQAMAEIFGVAGPGLTYDVMRYVAGHLAVQGVNIFNLFNFPLGRHGAYLAQELPVFTQAQPYCRFLPQFNRYLERLSYVSTVGECVCETGLYYPVGDLQGGLNAEHMAATFETLGRALEERMIAFDIVDDDAIEAAQNVGRGVLRIGRAAYRRLIIPPNACVPPSIQKILRRFVQGGGNVSHDLSGVSPDLDVEGEGLRVMHRTAEGVELFCLFRAAGESGLYRIHLPASSGYLPELLNGTLQRFEAEDGVLTLSLALGETAVILLTDEKLRAESLKEYGERFGISNGFRLRKDLELACDENGFRNIEHSDKSIPVDLGDWAGQIGSAYSGSAVYETEFTIPAEMIEKAGLLDLGDVHFAASVYLNGSSLGTAFMLPFRFRIPGGLLAQTNALKIVVTNTSANWYTHTDYFDKWNDRELSPYFAAEKAYAKDSASGGLYGPVVLFTE
ncbi:MAG: hypothetical protein IJT44_06505 [Clostridia bacterium]|nr:hypothetical protein [Clostridia bacterium]